MSGPGETTTRLDDIPTQWSLLQLAHQDTAGAGDARNALVLRYNRAIRSYVGALIPHPQDADEVAQEVMVRLLRGQFAAASPERGSFRRMLMVAARNLARTYWSTRQRRAGPALEQVAEPAMEEAERAGTATWQQAILDLAWIALRLHERLTPGNVTYSILRLRAEHPDADAEELAHRLSDQTGKAYRADAVRQQLRRARVRFAELLLEEVARSLDEPTPERVEEELIETGLMSYVRDLLPADWRTRGMLTE